MALSQRREVFGFAPSVFRWVVDHSGRLGTYRSNDVDPSFAIVEVEEVMLGSLWRTIIIRACVAVC